MWSKMIVFFVEAARFMLKISTACGRLANTQYTAKWPIRYFFEILNPKHWPTCAERMVFGTKWTWLAMLTQTEKKGILVF